MYVYNILLPVNKTMCSYGERIRILLLTQVFFISTLVCLIGLICIFNSLCNVLSNKIKAYNLDEFYRWMRQELE